MTQSNNLSSSGIPGERSPEAFTWQHPRLTPDREAVIRSALGGAAMRHTMLPAWMAATLLAEVDALRADGVASDS